MNQDQREARNASIRRSAQKRTRLRTCPECGRGNALRFHPDPTGYLGSVTTCRWCPHEKSHPPVLGAETTS